MFFSPRKRASNEWREKLIKKHVDWNEDSLIFHRVVMRKTSVSQYFHLKLSLLIFTLQWIFLFLDETKRDLGNSWNIFFRSKTKTLKIEEEKSSRKNKNCKAKPPQSYRILLGIPRLLSSLLIDSSRSSSRQFKLQCCKIDGRVVSERRRRSTRRSAEKKNVKFIMKRRRQKIIFNESNSSASENDIHKASQ